jgi:hypothetical protein
VQENRLVFVGASSLTDMENFGDQLLRDIYWDYFTQLLPDWQFETLQFGASARDTVAAQRQERDEQLASARGLVFVGGGYLGEGRLDHSSTKALDLVARHAWGWRNYRLYGKSARKATRKELPFAVLGVEYGPITSGKLRRASVDMLGQAVVSSVRNEESLRFAAEYGAKRLPVVAADAALGLSVEVLQRIYPKLAWEAVDRDRRDKSMIKVGLHIHDDSAFSLHPSLASDLSKLLAKLGREHSISTQYIHDQNFRGSPKARARDAVERITEIVPLQGEVMYTAPERLILELLDLDCVITTKLHVGLVARALGIPTLQFPTHKKIFRNFSFIGEEWRVVTPQEGAITRVKSLNRFVEEVGTRRPSLLAGSVRESALSTESLANSFACHLSDA